jgi:hypothetical protein
MNFVHWCTCMVHIKFTARSIIPVVSSEIESMASDKALGTSAQQGEASTEATSWRSTKSDRKSWSDDSRDSETTSNNGSSGVMKAHVGSMENYARYFPKGCGRAPGTESVPEPYAN